MSLGAQPDKLGYFRSNGRGPRMLNDYHGIELDINYRITVLETALTVLRCRGSKPVVLDVGAGAGNESIFLRRQGMSVLAGDTAMDGLKYIRDKDKRVKVASFSAIGLPVANKSVDLIHCKDVLPHIDDKVELFSEFKRVLKPDGLVILTSKTRGEKLTIFGVQYHPTNDRLIKKAAREASLSIIEERYWEPAKVDTDWYWTEGRHVQRKVWILTK